MAANLAKFGFIKLDFAVILEYCGNRLGISSGPERPTLCPILGVFMTGMVAFSDSYVQKLAKCTVSGGKFRQTCVGKPVFFKCFPVILVYCGNRLGSL